VNASTLGPFCRRERDVDVLAERLASCAIEKVAPLREALLLVLPAELVAQGASTAE
jgi:hypothetical protein